MRISLLRHLTIMTVATGVMISHTADAGLLFTRTPGGGDWTNPASWTGGTGFPDQPTEDARLISGTTLHASNTAIGIGGIEGAANTTLALGNSGSLTLNGIVPGGTTPFTASTLDRLNVGGDSVFVNAGSSNLTIDNLSISLNGRFRNISSALGRVDLINQHLLLQNAELDNQGILELHNGMSMGDSAVIDNRLGGTFILSGNPIRSLVTNDSSQIRNSATFSMTGGNLVLRSSQPFLNSGTFTQTGGNTELLNSTSGNTLRFSNTGLHRFNGGFTNVRSGAVLQNFSTYEQNNGTLTVFAGGNFDNGGDAQINGGVVNIVAGGQFNGFGFTTLNAGTMIVNGELIQTGFGGALTGLTLNGGRLQGAGVVRADVSNAGGTVGPGNSPGTLTVDGDYTQGAGGTLAMDIDSLLAFDVLDIMGAATLDGILDLQVDAAYAASAQNGDTFTIIEWDSFSGAFSSVTGLNFAANKFFTIDYGATGLTLTVNGQTVAAPEPGMIVLFGLGLAGIALARRRVARTAF